MNKKEIAQEEWQKARDNEEIKRWNLENITNDESYESNNQKDLKEKKHQIKQNIITTVIGPVTSVIVGGIIGYLLGKRK